APRRHFAGAARLDRGAPGARAVPARSLSDPARARRARDQFRAGDPDDHAAAGHRARRAPAAAALPGGLLHLAPRPAAKRRPDLGPGHRARRGNDDRRGGRRTHDDPRLPLGSRLRARRRGLANGPHCGGRHCAQAWGSAPGRRDRRGREPGQRRQRARPLSSCCRGRRLGRLLDLGRRLRFVWTAAGGIAVGLVIAYLIAAVRRRLDNPPVEVTISLLSGYFAYLPAAALGVSGVLSVVTVGVYMGWRTPELTSVQTRLDGAAAWQIVTFVVNALLFGLVGLQLNHILDSLSTRSAGELVADAVLVGLAVIVVRIIWIFPLSYVPWILWGRSERHEPAPPWQRPAVVSWMGLRGAVTLAAA